MDNQQGKTAWLAGLIDGEGWLGIRRNKRKNGVYVQPCFKLSMTSYPTLRYIESNFDFPFHIEHYEGRRKQNKKERGHNYWTLTVYGFRRILKFLPLVRDWLVTKQHFADYLIELSESRIERYKQPYTDREWELIELLSNQR